MSRRVKYRMEVDPCASSPGDGDHYCITVRPPLNRDDAYCRISVRGRTWGGSSTAVETHDEALSHIQDSLDAIKKKATDDKRRGSVTYYPEPPKPANTRYVVHPDYEGEIAPREVWGDATLSDFGVGRDTEYADRPWYQHRDAYDEWVAPLRESPWECVLQLYAKDIALMAYFWYIVHQDRDEDRLRVVKYEPESDRLKITTSSWTTATRTAGGIGLIHAPPALRQHVGRSESPFANGLEGIEAWVDDHHLPQLSKEDVAGGEQA